MKLFKIAASNLEKLRPQIAEGAQIIYNEWDEESGELGGGGICDLIAESVATLINNSNPDWIAQTVLASVGEQHVFVIVGTPEGVYAVDIPPSVYESGAGFSWNKKPDIIFTPSDVDIDLVNKDPNSISEYIDEDL